jgi:TolA-binding protein
MRAPLAALATTLLAVGLLVRPAPARAQVDSREGIALQNQIAELRQELQGLRDQVARTPPAGGGSALGGYQTPPPAAPVGGEDLTAQLLGRVEQLETEVRTLRGRVEEVENARQRQAEDLDKQIADLNFKLQNGAGAGPAAGGDPLAGSGRPTAALSPQPGNLAAQPPSAGAPPPPRRTPEQSLQEGNAALARKDYPAAEAAAKTVLAAGGPRAVDAQYLLARAAYGKRDFSNAAVAYNDTYTRSRTGVHAQDALLGLAASLTAIGEKRAACETLDKMAAEFPTLRADLRAPVATVRRDAACH